MEEDERDFTARVRAHSDQVAAAMVAAATDPETTRAAGEMGDAIERFVAGLLRAGFPSEFILSAVLPSVMDIVKGALKDA